MNTDEINAFESRIDLGQNEHTDVIKARFDHIYSK